MATKNVKFKVTVDGVEKADQQLNKVESGFKEAATNAVALGVALVGLKKGFDIALSAASKYFEQAAVENRIEAALKSTGNAANLTAKELFDLAAEMQNVSNYGDEQILGEVTNSLLTFKNIVGDTFKRTQTAVADMAVITGSLASASIMLGKAINAPTLGVASLNRVGVQFTDTQKDMIKGFEETNQLGKAQDIILTELESQFGGLAKAAVDPLKQIENTLGDIQEGVGKAFAPFFYNLNKVTKMFDEATDAGEALGFALKVGLGIAAGVVVVLTYKMVALAVATATVEGLMGGWISLIIGAAAGIATVFALTTDWTNEEEKLAKEIADTKKAVEELSTVVDALSESEQALLDIRDDAKSSAESMIGKYTNLATQLDFYSGIVKKTTTQQIAYDTAISDFNSTFGDYLGEIDDGILKNNTLAGSFRSISAAIVQQATLKGYTDQIEELASQIAKVQASEDFANQDVYSNRIAELKQANMEMENTAPLIRKMTLAEKQYFDQSAWGMKFQSDNSTVIQNNLKEIASLQTKMANGNVEDQQQAMDRIIALWQEGSESLEGMFKPIDISVEAGGSLPSNEGFLKALAEQKSALAQYYADVTFMDSEYYKLRTDNIYAQAEVLRASGKEEVNIKRWVKQQKEELNEEYKEYLADANEEELSVVEDHAKKITASLKGIQLDYLNGFKGFTKSVVSAWKNLVNQIINQIIMSGILKFIGIIVGGAIGGAAGVANGAGGLTLSGVGGGFMSVDNNPWDTANTVSGTVGSNMQLSAPSNNNANFSDAQVEKIVDAINQNRSTSVQIDSIEIAKASEKGNLQRSVL